MKLSFKLKCVVYVVWFLFLTSVSNVPVFASNETGNPGTKMIVQGNNSFCFDLYRQFKKEEGNIFFSPYSISTALAKTYAGARGITEKEMAKALHFTLPQEKLHPAFSRIASYLKSIQKKGNIALSIANALWIQKNFKLKKDYLKTTEKFYAAVPFPVDFIPAKAREKTRKKINLWVEDKTGGKIKNLILKGILTSATRLVLTNAVYFKGDWAARFKESQTREAPFWVSPGKKIDVPMMYQANKFKYMEDKDVQVLQMPYKGEETSMFVILPREKSGVEKVEQGLNFNRLNHWSAGLRERKVMVFFPKFKMTCKYSLAKVLITMGMGSAFSASANFSGMAYEFLFIDDVLHKAFVEVNEEGTEAAAATAVLFKKGGGGGRIPMFKADHPFIFIIKENETGSILFMGRVSDPS